MKFERRFGRPGGINHNDPVELRKGQSILYVELITNFNGQLISGLGPGPRFEILFQAGRQGGTDPVVAAAGIADADDQDFGLPPAGNLPLLGCWYGG